MVICIYGVRLAGDLENGIAIVLNDGLLFIVMFGGMCLLVQFHKIYVGGVFY